MTKILNSPGKYIQGAGVLGQLGSYAQTMGKQALVLLSAGGRRRSGGEIQAGFAASDCGALLETFGGECCKAEIDRLAAVVRDRKCDVVAGVGGGKIFDTAKAVAYFCHVPVIICPTVASSDAPCSALSVLYTEDGVFAEYLSLPKNPDMVLMDTAVIAASPVRLTVSGMGDALATYFEARACKRRDAATCAGGKATLAAMALARLCFDTLMAEGEMAKLALEAGTCTPAVEQIIEANTLLSGLGFESGGLAAAHAIHNGLTVLPECHALYHGEKVAFGTIAQLVLEDAPAAELEQVLGFCRRVGLPTTLAQLGVTEPTPEKLAAVAARACDESDTIHNMPFEVTPESVRAALLTADRLGARLCAG